MSSKFLLRTKEALTHIGARLSQNQIAQAHAVVDYLKAGRWLKDHGFSFEQRTEDRTQVWRRILSDIAGRQTLYLEFGVYQGESTRFWARELQHPNSLLHGFDSFEGLPEQGGGWTKGQFNVDGQVPVIDDARVKFFKGWFNETLPEYMLPPHDCLLINLDADIYSSTAFVLSYLQPHIRIGTYIYFDEFCRTDHEARAFDEFLAETGYKFRPVAADRTLNFVSFQRIG